MLRRLDLSVEHATWLEDERHIPSELAERIGIVSKGSDLAFEYRQKGVPQVLKIRKALGSDGSRLKTYWLEPKGVPLSLWNEDSLSDASPDETLIVTEGELDAASWIAAGQSCVVSVPNGAAGKPGEGDIDPASDKQFGYLWDGAKLKPELAKFRKVVLATDADAPGRILADELAVRLGRQRCWTITYPDGCKDANEVLVKYGELALREMLAAARPMVPDFLCSFDDIPERNTRRTYSSGWREMDDNLMMVLPELMIVTGAPGSGKSQWTLNLGYNLAKNYALPGAVLQFEDDVERNRNDLIRLYLADHPNARREDAKVWIGKRFRTIAPAIDTDHDYTIDWLRETIEFAAVRHGCRWIIVDPWNEVEHAWKINESETAYTNNALRWLKALSRRLEVALIIVTHPSKAGGQQKSIGDMSLYDVAGSAAWKNKADHGVIVHREGQTTYVKIDKSKNWRTMGTPGVNRMKFDPGSASFHYLGKGVLDA